MCRASLHMNSLAKKSRRPLSDATISVNDAHADYEVLFRPSPPLESGRLFTGL